MNQSYLKQPLFITCILFAIACFTACTKKNIHSNNTNYNSGGKGPGSATGDTTGTADSLASFNSPAGLALDAAGNIYVADYGNNMIRKISTTGIVTTIAGSGNQGSINGVAKLASFNGPTALAIDGSGNIYVADDNNNRIRKITPAGIVSTFAGSDSVGSANGADTAATFFGTEGITIGPAGNIYVADAGNNLIRMITTNGLVSTYAGNGNPGAANGDKLSATFNNPTGLAADAAGNIYVADFLNNMVRTISTSGTVSTLAGSGNSGSADSTGSTASFYFPNSVAVDASGNVYVTEYVNNVIRKISPGGAVSTFAGSGSEGQADSTGTAASFNGPSGVAVDAAGNVYIADTYNNVIRKITPAGVVTTIAGSGYAGAVNGNALALSARTKRIVAAARRAHNYSNSIYNMLVKKHLMR